MKSLIFTFLALASAFASAMVNDGCYVMYDSKNTTMYPAFCISGANEEVIAGSNARLVLFHTNTDEPTNCFLTSAISFQDSGVTQIEINGRVEMSLVIKSQDNQNLISGDVTVGKTVLQFKQLDQKLTEHYYLNILTSGICK